MIQKEDSPERRELARDLVQVAMGLQELHPINRHFRQHGAEIRQSDQPGRTIFRIFQGRTHIDTFIFEDFVENS